MNNSRGSGSEAEFSEQAQKAKEATTKLNQIISVWFRLPSLLYSCWGIMLLILLLYHCTELPHQSCLDHTSLPRGVATLLHKGL